MLRLNSFIRIAVVCLGVAATGAAMGQGATYPITIKHAYGETVIEKKPERVATVNFANQEVPLALGVVPVGFARATFGDDDGDGVLPWVAARLKQLGAETPVLFNEGDGIDFEAVAATEPDVILAAYSGISQKDYETLSQIAPVVAFPEGPWSTQWRDMIRLNSTAMGMAAEGQALIEKLEAEIAAVKAQHPELAGKTAMFITHLNARDLSKISFYSASDTRVQFFEDLGLKMPKSVSDVTESGKYSGSISAEKIDMFDDVDILVTYGGPDLLKAVQDNPLTGKMPAVERQSVVVLTNSTTGNAAMPTPLNISWLLEDYAAMLGEAARKVK